MYINEFIFEKYLLILYCDLEKCLIIPIVLIIAAKDVIHYTSAFINLIRFHKYENNFNEILEKQVFLNLSSILEKSECINVWIYLITNRYVKYYQS